MILLDQPYISDFLKKTIRENNLSAIDTGNVIINNELELTNTEAFINKFREGFDSKIYSSSENAIGWILKNLSFSDYPEKINFFKNKFLFRTQTKEFFPDFYFQEVKFNEINSLNVENMSFPFIIKPNVGFFSMGVHKVLNLKDWDRIKSKIISEINDIQNVYPEEVLSTSSFIIEQCAEGTEYAFDAYFNDKGEPVVLGIMKHVFASETDVSDRVYLTSKSVIKENLSKFDTFLKQIGSKISLKNFPLHAEVRIDKNGKLTPIEINALRFGAWCTSAELANYAFGINEYLLFMNNQKPDWETILNKADNKIYSLVIFDNSTGYKAEEIKSFNYEKAMSSFQNPLELRKTDYNKYPLFGFLYVKVDENRYFELDNILHSDLKEFVELY
ncbi:MAG: ATP-grasp domain-containing protein [Bacteroidetes bacterium GWA2_31_9]|nr:MAG: ATP-grasp domain-containing protein [Bacteroidetes bacterium GWA2_31_9]